MDSEEWFSLGMVSSPYSDTVRNEGVSYISILRSREIVGRVVDKLNLQKLYEDRDNWLFNMIKQPFRLLFYGRFPATTISARDEAIERTRKSLRIILISGSSVLQVSARHKNADKVWLIVNELMKAAVTYSDEINTQSAIKIMQLMEKELTVIGGQKNELIVKLEKLRKANGIKSVGTIKEQIAAISQRINALERKVDERAAALVISDDRIAELQKRINVIPEHHLSRYTVDQNPEIQGLRQALMEQKLALINQQIDFQSESPQIQARKEQIAATELEIKKALADIKPVETFDVSPGRDQLFVELINTEIESVVLPIEIEKLNGLIDSLNDQASEFTAAHEELSVLEKEIEVLQSSETKAQIIVKSARQLSNVHLSEFNILSEAVMPRYPSINKIPLAFYVFFAALIGALIAIFYVLGVPEDARVWDPFEKFNKSR